MKKKIKWKENEIKNKFKKNSAILGWNSRPDNKKSSLFTTTLSIESFEGYFYNNYTDLTCAYKYPCAVFNNMLILYNGKTLPLFVNRTVQNIKPKQPGRPILSHTYPGKQIISNVNDYFAILFVESNILHRHEWNTVSAMPCCDSIWATTWQNQQNECAPSEDSDQPGHPPSLISLRCVLNG